MQFGRQAAKARFVGRERRFLTPPQARGPKNRASSARLVRRLRPRTSSLAAVEKSTATDPSAWAQKRPLQPRRQPTSAQRWGLMAAPRRRP